MNHARYCRDKDVKVGDSMVFLAFGSSVRKAVELTAVGKDRVLVKRDWGNPLPEFSPDDDDELLTPDDSVEARLVE